VVAGPYIHVSGSTATVDGVLQHEGDAYAQTKTAFKVIEKALAQGGHSLRDVVRTRLYLANESDMDAAGKAH
jgi:enamine deaminase RidA (YjgF/YER057c/UK114 family)